MFAMHENVHQHSCKVFVVAIFAVQPIGMLFATVGIALLFIAIVVTAVLLLLHVVGATDGAWCCMCY